MSTKTIRISDVAELLNGTVNPPDFPDRIFCHYSLPAYDLTKQPSPEKGSEIKSHKFEVHAGTVLISKLNPFTPRIWKVVSLPGPACVASTEFLVLKPKIGISLDELFLILSAPSLTEFLSSLAAGTSNSHQRVRPADVLAAEVEIPADVLALRNAADLLATLDDKIELNRRMNETLEQMARALFKSWFVDFDPVHAKAAGRQPVGMDKATADLFPDSFEDSELGPIPKGWKVGLVDDLVEQKTERVDATPAKDMMRYIALEDMPSRSLDLSSHQLGSAVNSSIIMFSEGDILFGSMRPYFHKVGVAFFDGITRTTTFVLRPKKQHFRHFALFHLFSDDLISHATTASVGTTIPYVKWESLERYQIIVPTDQLLKLFDNQIRKMIEKIGANGAESRNLKAIRDSLLPDLLDCSSR